MSPPTRHSPLLQQDPSPRPTSAPMSPPTPTHHNNKYTKVSKTTCTHQTNIPTKSNQKTSNRLSINLPSIEHHRRPAPLQIPLSQKSTKNHTRHIKSANTHKYLAPADLHPTHSPQLPPQTKHNGHPPKPKHNPPSPRRPSHPTRTPHRSKISAPSPTTFRPLTSNTRSTDRYNTPRKLQHNQDDSRTSRSHAERRNLQTQTTHRRKAAHLRQLANPQKTNDHSDTYSVLSPHTPFGRHSQTRGQTPHSTKKLSHPTPPKTATDSSYALTPRLDLRDNLHSHQSLQIPPNRTHFLINLTHPTLTLHSYHTAMAPINDASHTLAHPTRSNPGSKQDSRSRLRGGNTTGHQTRSSDKTNNQTRSSDRAGKPQPGCEEGEGAGAAQPAGAETRSRNGSKRRALITDYSDDEEREAAAPTLSQQGIIKEKALPSHDYDIDMMQLEDLSPEHGGSSLQLSSPHNEYAAIPNQAAISTTRLDVINLADATPTTSHKSPRKGTISDTQSAKRRRNEEGRHTTSLGASKLHQEKTKEAVPSIDMVAHMWLGFPIHEAIATQRGKEIIHEHRTPEEFTRLGTPTKEVIEFKTLRRAFPRVPQIFYPHERPDAVPGNHLHFTQIPRLEKIDPATGLSEGFHVTI